MADFFPFRIDLAGQLFDAGFMHKDLDARLELVVTPTMKIIDTDDCRHIGQHVLDGQEVTNFLGHHRRAALPAADINGKAKLARLVLLQLQADIVHLNGRTVMLGPDNRNLELARQIGKFRVQRRPLPQDFGKRAWVRHFVGGSTCKMVGSHIANAIAGGLDGMHFHLCQLCQNLRNILQRRPVILDVLARREMAKATVISARDRPKLAQLAAGQRSIGDCHAQHIGMQLQVKAVHQPQGLELVFRQLARKAARNLILELGNAGCNKIPVEFIITIHRLCPTTDQEAGAGNTWPMVTMVGPDRRMRSRRRIG